MTAYEEHLVNNGWSPEEAAEMYQKFSDPTFSRDPEMMREYQPGFSLVPKARREQSVTVAPQYASYGRTGETFLRQELSELSRTPKKITPRQVTSKKTFKISPREATKRMPLSNAYPTGDIMSFPERPADAPLPYTPEMPYEYVPGSEPEGYETPSPTSSSPQWDPVNQVYYKNGVKVPLSDPIYTQRAKEVAALQEPGAKESWGSYLIAAGLLAPILKATGVSAAGTAALNGTKKFIGDSILNWRVGSQLGKPNPWTPSFINEEVPQIIRTFPEGFKYGLDPVKESLWQLRHVTR